MVQILLKLLGSKFGKFAGLLLMVCLLFIVRVVVYPRDWPFYSILYWVILAVLIIAVYLAWIAYSNIQTKKKNKALADSLVEDARRDEASARPDKRKDYSHVRANLEYAISLLEKSRPKDYKGAALYRLPWVMVVGPPADGKTTAIMNAGIQWPQDPRLDEATRGAFGKKVGGSGGTRSCNWFFSSEAIILDTAGRFQARDQGEIDENEWLQFLKMIQRYRPRRPVNGVIALCSVERVLGDSKEADEWAKKIRRQINEIMEQLGTHVPVYLIFNKCDLIHGFIEYFQDLNKEARKQVWGFTRNYRPQMRKSGQGLASELDSIKTDLDFELDSLFEVVEKRRLNRLNDPELFPSEKSALCIFPSEFGEMREPIKRFIKNVFYENPYGHNPILRGVYFTSATQYEGNPIVQLMNQVAGEYDIPLDALPVSSKQTVDTYFLHDLMTDVVFKDEHLGGRFKRSLYDRTRMFAAAGVVAATLLIGLWMILSYTINSSKNSDIFTLAEQTESVKWAQDLDGRVEALTMLDQLREKLDDYESTGSVFGLFYWLFGRGKLGELTQSIDEMLAAKTREMFVEYAYNSSARVLKTAIRDHSEYISSFRTYRYLTDSTKSSEVRAATVANFIVNQRFSRLKDPEKRSNCMFMLSKLMNYYAESTSAEQYEREQKLVDRAMKRINDEWDWLKYLSEVLEDYTRSDEGALTTSEFDLIKGRAVVPYVFTNSGWEDYTQDILDSAYSDITDDPILDTLIGEAGRTRDRSPLEDAFVHHCKRFWKSFFEDIEFDSEGMSKFDLLLELSGGQSPLEQLFVRAAEESGFQQPGLQSFFADLHSFTGIMPQTGYFDSLPIGGSSDEEKMPPIDDYMLAVGGLEKAVDASDASEQCAKAYTSARAKIRQARNDLGIDLRASSLSSDLSRLLDKPFELATSVAAGNAGNCLNSIWASDVYGHFESNLRDYYPFSPTGTRDVSHQSISSFFSYAGPLRTFDRDEAAPAKKAGFGLSSNYKRALSLGKAIYDLVGESGSTIKLMFRNNLVQPMCERITMSDGSGTPFLSYANGPDEQAKMKLPWQSEYLELRMTMSDRTNVEPFEFEGVWAPLKLLERTEFDENMNGRLHSESNRDMYIGFKLVGTSSESPVRLFRDFRSKLPKKISN